MSYIISDNKTVYATFSRDYTATFIDYKGTAKLWTSGIKGFFKEFLRFINV